MTNMFDYLTWRGDLTFSQVRPNPVDALIFSTLAYVFYGDKAKAEPSQAMTLGECAAEFFTLENLENRVRVKKDMELLRAAAATTRRLGDAPRNWTICSKLVSNRNAPFRFQVSDKNRSAKAYPSFFAV